jgi:hypothetical protein
MYFLEVISNTSHFQDHMDRSTPLWGFNSFVQPSTGCLWTTNDRLTEPSYYRSDMSQTRPVYNQSIVAESMQMDLIPPSSELDTKEPRRTSFRCSRSTDSSMLGVSPMVPWNYRKTDISCDLPPRTKFAKRCRPERIPALESKEDADNEAMFNDLKRICLPTIDKQTVTVKTLCGHKLSLEYVSMTLMEWSYQKHSHPQTHFLTFPF